MDVIIAKKATALPILVACSLINDFAAFFAATLVRKWSPFLYSYGFRLAPGTSFDQ